MLSALNATILIICITDLFIVENFLNIIHLGLCVFFFVAGDVVPLHLISRLNHNPLFSLKWMGYVVVSKWASNRLISG